MFDPSISLDLNRLRTRPAKMDDAELQRFGHAAAYMTTQEANLGSEPRPVFALELEEAREEWRRRHPKALGESPPLWRAGLSFSEPRTRPRMVKKFMRPFGGST